jgi:hypothetical protein
MTFETLDRRQILRLSAAAVAAPAATWPGAGANSAHDAIGSRLRHRGVVYPVVDTGSPDTSWSPERMAADVRTITEDLHANSLLLEGDGPARLLTTAREAAGHGLSVWLRPTLGDVPERQILEHLGEVAAGAQQLRRDGARVVLSVGCEFVLYVPGIVPGADVLERVRNLLSGNFDPVSMQKRLDTVISHAAKIARAKFSGPVTYSAAEDDIVDWSLFDIVGINYYSWFPSTAGYRRDLKQFQGRGKPLAITEFGACTYRDAPRLGADGLGWDVVDYTADPPRLKQHLERSERAQADHIVRMLRVFDDVGVMAAMIFTFGDADAPHRKSPWYDLDLASYGMMAPIWTACDEPGRGWHWRPKRGFSAAAEEFARLGQGFNARRDVTP